MAFEAQMIQKNSKSIKALEKFPIWPMNKTGNWLAVSLAYLYYSYIRLISEHYLLKIMPALEILVPVPFKHSAIDELQL